MSRYLIGKEKEEIACKYLISKGYTILHRNFRSKFGEIDIVAKDKDTIVFVEVRSKASDRFGTPQESIRKKKVDRITKTAQFYISNFSLSEENFRFDVISILEDRLEHIQNAFCMDF